MPVASESIRRACVESAQSIMWGWCGRMTAPIGLWVQPTTTTAWHGCWDLLLNEDLGGCTTPALRLIILLVCVRHLMLLGPRNAGGWMSWPNNDCSFDSRSSSTEHRVQHIVMEGACQCQPFCITCVISAPSWPRWSPLHTQLLRVGFCRSRWPISSALSVSCPAQGKAVVDGGAETD